MSKHNFVRNGVTRLPPGFRFQPTDEELLFHYLRCKIFSLPLPAYIIPEIHFSNLDPWELPGESTEDRYFFAKKGAKYNSGNKKYRVTNSSYWEVTGSEEHISPPPNENLDMMMGIKKTLVFNIRKSPNNCHRTDWFMHEYSLAMASNTYYKNYKITSDWVICHVFNKTRREEAGDIMIQYNNNRDYDYNIGATSSKFNEMVFFENACPCSSSSSSSNSVTEVHSNELQSDEETSYFM